MNLLSDFDEIRIENTNHCSFKCFFCPREELTRAMGFMTLPDLTRILCILPDFRGLVDLHGFGEPLLDRLLIEKVALIKEKWPLAKTRIYSTLGIKYSDANFDKLFRAGLDRIEVSLYGVDREAYLANHGVDKFDLAKANLLLICNIIKMNRYETSIALRDFPVHDEVKQSPADYDTMLNFRQWVVDIGVSEIKTRALHNFGEGRKYNIAADDGMCSIVWGYRRRVLQVTWNMDVIPCCFDFDASIKFGNLRDSTIEEIFSSAEYSKFIQAHKDNNLDNYSACRNCERCFQA